MALNKKGINVSRKQYYEEWDIPTTQAAVCVAGFEKPIEDWIWTREYKPFEMIKGQ